MDGVDKIHIFVLLSYRLVYSFQNFCGILRKKDFVSDLMNRFDPNGAGVSNGNYFGLPYILEESDIVVVSVPWDVTTSYMPGTSRGPQAIIDASPQIELFDPEVEKAWSVKIATFPIDHNICRLNEKTRKVAEEVIGALERGIPQEQTSDKAAVVNAASEVMNGYVYGITSDLLSKGKKVALVGGEHSVPFGYIRALAEKYSTFGILHIDAHADLRKAYEGFEYSHASIMYNVLDKIPQVTGICQVAVRDFCEAEHRIMRDNGKVHAFTAAELDSLEFTGSCWDNIYDRIISSLPENVYISFDIDGLDPKLCPNTGTPVPGGLSYGKVSYLLSKLRRSGKNLIGFDLCEVAPGKNNEWDANVGARLLFKLCLYLQTNK